MKKRPLLALLFIICYLLFVMSACSDPSAEAKGVGYFTISLSASENMRAAYPPANTSNLKFIAKFKDTINGTEKTYASDGSGKIQGKIDVGSYIVTMDVSLISDKSSYARGIAYDNPVTIGSGQNSIKVYAYDINNAAPPVISAKPRGVSSSYDSTTPALQVSASVNDGGVISYQWYSNTTNSNSGGTAISGATSNSYTPSTAASGTAWYYVVVTNRSTGKPTTISTVPVAIGNGVKTGGSGTASDPFLVYDVTTLRKVGTGTDGWSLSAHYKQTEDIILPQVSQGGSNWTPIGTETVSFTGSYDGNGKTISNLTINAPTEDNQGLFGEISASALVKNVGLANCTIIGNYFVGGVTAFNYGTVQNCYVTGYVTGYVTSNVTGNISSGCVGGVVGANHDNGKVQNCYFTGIFSGDVALGGIAGANTGTVQDCYSTGSVSGFASCIGGVVGNNNGTLINSYATGNVSGSHTVGGVVGDNYGTVQYCYATGNVSGSIGDIGGVVGKNDGTVLNCYATGNVSGPQEVGGVVGGNSEGTVQNCYATGDVSSTNSSGYGYVGGVVGSNYGIHNDIVMEGTVQNCVALNSNISANGTYIGRVLGIFYNYNGIAILANNYGRSDMKMNGSSFAWANIGLNDHDGASITSSDWGNQSWWTNTAGWNFNTVWQWGSNNLPALRNMPGTATQNPVVK